MIDLAFVWIVIIAVGVLIYVVLDGFDLGIGILFPFVEKEQERDVMMNTVAPVWDGNETWMVLGGAGLFAALPLFSVGLAHSHLLASLAQGQWLLAGMDLTLLASAALLGYAAWKLNRHQPLQRPQRQPRTVNTRQESAA